MDTCNRIADLIIECQRDHGYDIEFVQVSPNIYARIQTELSSMRRFTGNSPIFISGVAVKLNYGAHDRSVVFSYSNGGVGYSYAMPQPQLNIGAMPPGTIVSVPQNSGNVTISPVGAINQRRAMNTPWGNPSVGFMWDDDAITDITSKPEDKESKQKYCYHEWKAYKGFTEDYDFCVKCDKKRDN